MILKGGLSIYKSLYEYLLYLDFNLPYNYYYLLINRRIILLSILFLSKNLEFLQVFSNTYYNITNYKLARKYLFLRYLVYIVFRGYY